MKRMAARAGARCFGTRRLLWPIEQKKVKCGGKESTSPFIEPPPSFAPAGGCLPPSSRPRDWRSRYDDDTWGWWRWGVREAVGGERGGFAIPLFLDARGGVVLMVVVLMVLMVVVVSALFSSVVVGGVGS